MQTGAAHRFSKTSRAAEVPASSATTEPSSSLADEGEVEDADQTAVDEVLRAGEARRRVHSDAQPAWAGGLDRLTIMGSKPRMSPQTLALLNVLLENPVEWKYGLELIEALGIKGGTVYPTLARLERLGWLESKREEAEPSEVGRPRRKHYRLTGEGQRQAESALERWRSLLGMSAGLPVDPEVKPA